MKEGKITPEQAKELIKTNLEAGRATLPDIQEVLARTGGKALDAAKLITKLEIPKTHPAYPTWMETQRQITGILSNVNNAYTRTYDSPHTH